MYNGHAKFPIWVWLYDYGYITHPEVWGEKPKLTHPQAHSYAFLTEQEAREHPDKVGWGKDHGYVLQRTYLQTNMDYPGMSGKAVIP